MAISGGAELFHIDPITAIKSTPASINSLQLNELIPPIATQGILLI